MELQFLDMLALTVDEKIILQMIENDDQIVIYWFDVTRKDKDYTMK